MLDRQAMASVKRIGFPTPGFRSSPTVGVANLPEANLGLIGAVAASARAVTERNRGKAITDVLQDRNFDAPGFFSNALTERLATHGWTLVPFAAESHRFGYLSAYPDLPAVEAMLDVCVLEYGFTAVDDSKFYRPSTRVKARLQSGKTILMERNVKSLGPTSPERFAAAGGREYATYEGIERDPEGTVGSVRAALTFAVDAIEIWLT